MTLPMPNHIAFIMDGNGRWAKSRGFERIKGHERGAKTLREITRFCRRNGVGEITFYALSTENYRARPRMEVRYLMTLLRDYLVGERNEIREQNIRLCSIGRVDDLPKNVLRELRTSEELSRDNDGMVLRLALNYGSRGEILDAVAKIGDRIQAGELNVSDLGELTEEEFTNYLYDPGMADPDLLIRTAGEMRVSNFLLWQISYTELWVTEAKWPDFEVSHLEEAIRSYQGRERRFGKLPGDSGTSTRDLVGEDAPK